GGDAGVWLYDATNMDTMPRLLEGHTRGVTSVAFSSDGSLLASGSEDQTVRVWDVKTGQTTATLEGHHDNVVSVAFSPDGSQVVSASWHTLQLWDIKTGQVTATWEDTNSDSVPMWVTSVAFSPDGSFIVSANDSRGVDLWDVKTGQPTIIQK